MTKLIISVLWLAIAGTSAMAACSRDELSLRGDWGRVSFAVEVVDTVKTRAQGLMFRENLAQFSGMLFVYPSAGPVAFWMKNTLIPLDMIFFDETGTVRRVHARAVPGDLTAIKGGPGILAVLEINGGLAAQLGITPGSQVQHPAFDQGTSVWPCP